MGFSDNIRTYVRPRFAAILAVLISLVSVLVTYQVSQQIFSGMPHLEDEFAYIWEARLMASGHILVASPPYPGSFLVPFVVDLPAYPGAVAQDMQSRRFGKYPPGWPALLALGIKLGVRDWVNPLLGGLGVWLTFVLGKRLFTPWIGLLAAGLTASSPFFLMNSSVMLSHPLGLVLSLGFTLCWLEAFWREDSLSPVPLSPASPWLAALLAGLLLGVLALTRPFTAIGVAVPFAVHAVTLLWRGSRQVRLRLIIFGLVAAAVAGLLFVWQYLLTGNPWLNPYTLWWPYDKIGFGPGYGVTQSGHNLRIALQNMVQSLGVGVFDFFGWGPLSWIFLPAGVLAIRRNRPAWLAGGVFPALVILYLAYWIGSYLFGPRYYYEGFFSLTLLSAAGIARVAGWPVGGTETVPTTGLLPRHARFHRLAPALTVVGLILLVGLNFLVYTPARLGGLKNLFGISRESLKTFQTPEVQAIAPALIIVHTDHWREYGAFIELEDPALTTPLIFAWNMDPQTDENVAAIFPNRTVYHYYPDDPGRLYLHPK